MKILLVGGTFNNEGGKDSGYIDKLWMVMRVYCQLCKVNGGYFEYLNSIVLTEGFLKQYDAILWFANVDNSEEKIVRRIKEIHPTCLLVTSKANYSGDYTFMELIARTLQNKANLLVEFRKDVSTDPHTIKINLIDPLGNLYTSNLTGNIDEAARAIMDRLEELYAFTRIGSEQISPDAIVASANSEFLKTITECGEKFHALIHGANTSRFLGNASFRCESGFPSYRGADNLIFVSKRNIDKRDIGSEGFVACSSTSMKRVNRVQYFGGNKPSVDTPVQLLLYNYYQNINFMIHSHCYVYKAPFTSEKIPCGAIEEVIAIKKVIPWVDLDHFAINLLGHGSIILCNSSYDFERYTRNYIARPTPER